MTGNENSLIDYAKVTNSIADELNVLAKKIMSYAGQINKIWRSSAAEHAQRALKKIYESILPLAAAHASISSLAHTCAEEILTPAKHRFDLTVASENWLQTFSRMTTTLPRASI